MAEKMRVFHITKRAEDGKWTVKEEKTDDVLHTFDTRVEATQYCEQFAEEKDALLKYHASKGKNKGRIIEVYNSRTMDPKEFAKLMEKYEEENDALTDEDEGPAAVEEEKPVEKKAPVSTFEFNLVFNSCIQLKCELFVKKRKKLRLKYSYG